MTTNFYVCQRKKLGGDESRWDWHAGITDKDHYKKRSSRYMDCIFWEQFASRSEAKAFEASVSVIVPFIYAEQIHEMWGEPGDVLAVGDDTPQTVDALSLSTVYYELYKRWAEGTFRPHGLAFIRCKACHAYGSMNVAEVKALISELRSLIPEEVDDYEAITAMTAHTLSRVNFLPDHYLKSCARNPELVEVYK